MDFSEALIELKEGNLIFRKSKGRRNFVVLANNLVVTGFLENADEQDLPMLSSIINVSDEGICVWIPTPEDLLADDWEFENLE